MAKKKTIYRNASRENPYAQIIRKMLQDETLSLEAAGALVFILSLPETWEFDFDWFRTRRRIGRDKALRLVRELIAHRYCRKVRERDSKGRLLPVVYEFSDDPDAFPPLTENQEVDAQDVVSPLTEKPSVDNPTVAKPSTDNPTAIERLDTSQSIKTDRTKEKEGAGSVASLGTDEPLPFSSDVIDAIAALGVDVDELVDRYLDRTSGRRIADPSAYLLRMAQDEAAKRLGVTADQIKNSTSRNREARIAAAVDATGAFSVPSDEAIAIARRRGRRFIDEVLADLASRKFSTQQACDQAFELALVNARFRPPKSATLPDLFTPADPPQQKDHAA